MLKVNKEWDGQWLVWNTNTDKIATIVRIDDSFMGKKKPCRYRVDQNGVTVASMLENFAVARKTANKHVR